MTNYQILGACLSIGGVIVSIPAFFIVRWMNRMEESIKLLTKAVHETEVKEARVFGKVEAMCDSVDKLNQTVGSLGSSVGKIWDVIIRKGFAETRPSDSLNGKKG